MSSTVHSLVAINMTVFGYQYWMHKTNGNPAGSLRANPHIPPPAAAAAGVDTPMLEHWIRTAPPAVQLAVLREQNAKLKAENKEKYALLKQQVNNESKNADTAAVHAHNGEVLTHEVVKTNERNDRLQTSSDRLQDRLLGLLESNSGSKGHPSEQKPAAVPAAGLPLHAGPPAAPIQPLLGSTPSAGGETRLKKFTFPTCPRMLEQNTTVKNRISWKGRTSTTNR